MMVNYTARLNTEFYTIITNDRKIRLHDTQLPTSYQLKIYQDCERSAMEQDWILLTKETRRAFSSATWVPLRASGTDEKGDIQDIGYTSEFFGCGSVAFPPEHREDAEKFSWSEIGIGHNVEPYAYKDGYYASIEQYQRNDKEPIGVNLVFEHPQPVVG